VFLGPNVVAGPCDPSGRRTTQPVGVADGVEPAKQGLRDAPFGVTGLQRSRHRIGAGLGEAGGVGEVALRGRQAGVSEVGPELPKLS